MFHDFKFSRLVLAIIPLACVGAAVIWTLAYAVDSSPESGGAETKTYAYPLRHAQAAELQRSVSVLLPEGSEVRVEEQGNRLIVRGTQHAHELARAAIESLDRASPGRMAPEGTSAQAVLRAYSCPAAQAALEAARLRQKYPQEGVRIAADPRSGQILVLAPAQVQTQIARQFTAAADTAVAQVSPPTARPALAESGAAETHTVPLQRSRATEIEAALVGVFGSRLAATSGATAQHAAYRLVVPAGGAIDLAFDRAANQVTVRGSGRPLESCIHLIRGLDLASRSPEASTRFVSLSTTTPTSLQRTIAAVAQAGEADQPPPAPEEQPEELPQPDQPAEPGAAPGAALGEASGSLIGSVRVEMLEGLDVLVIRGHQRDVDRVIEIINEIERLSGETEPAIEVYQLAHVDCTALGDLVRQLYDQVFSPRQGTVSITALVKPNAILLVGRAPSVATVVDLIKRLDQPVAPDSQFRVFQLRHAWAETAQAQVETFYSERGVLGTKVRVTADFRSNALIVQASPRDMMELAELIGRIDTPSSAAINELRVFHLENSLASELAPILQEAVITQTTGATTRSAAATAAGVAGAAATSSRQTSGQKSAMLRFFTVDGSGKQQLNSGILTDVRITADTRANALLVSAPADSMELLAALIEQMDKLPAVEAQIKVFTVVNGDATNLVELLQTLFAQETQQTTESPAITTGARQGDSSLVPLRFGVDVRTNSVIATGNTGDLSIVEAILLRLDGDDIRNRKSMIYRLKNASSDDVAEALNEFLESERDVETATEGLYSTFEQIDREVVIVSETVSNSLIVSATPRYFEEIRELIDRLDERPPMVMIQVLIAEVKLDNFNEFGVELGLQDSLLFDRSLLDNLTTVTTTKTTSTSEGVVTEETQTVVGGDNTPGFNFNNQDLGNSGSDKALANSSSVGSQGLSTFGVGRTNSELGYGGMVLSASSESVSILVRALQQCGRLQVLSRPQIMTMDNQQAQVQVGQTVSLIRSTSTNEAGQTNSVTEEEIGLILQVTPRVSPDGQVVMSILAEKSSLGAEADGTPVSISATGEVIRQPPINTTNAETVVAAANGQTIVLGGLITRDKEEVKRRVPYLSNIPILGALFRYDSTSDVRTELLIVMTPHIVKNEADMDVLRQTEVARMHWCLCDVVEVHGDGGLRGRQDEWSDAEAPTVYPDMRGEGEIIPTPEGTPATPQPILRPDLGPAPEPPSSQWIPTPAGTASPTSPPSTQQPTPAAAASQNPVAPATWYQPYPSTSTAAGSGSVQPATYGAPVASQTQGNGQTAAPAAAAQTTWNYR